MIKSTAADRQSVEVTVYNRDLGLVKEQRNIKIEAGEGELQFIDVPAEINPVTVHIKPLSNAENFAVLEQNYEYDLISHAKLMDKYVGKAIKIVEWNEYHDRKNTVDAELLSAANGKVYKIGDEIYLGHPGVKVLPELPGNLISRPTLSWLYRSGAAGERQIEVSYLTGGMNWSADYILVVPADGNAGAELSGWVTLDNNSGAEFADAKLKLVAGNVNRVRGKRSRHDDVAVPRLMRCTMDSPFEESELFEYHIYDLARPTTLKNNQTKQISLMEAHGVAVAKEYITSRERHYSFKDLKDDGGSPIKQSVMTFLAFKNTKENNLGNPMPAGIIRIYTADIHGRQQFIGEDRIDHTPKDEDIRLKVGEAFDIVAERSQVGFKEITSKIVEAEYLISIRNRKEEDITVGVVENAYHRAWQILESTHEYIKVSVSTFRFDVPVGKGQEVQIKYKIRIGI
jgi:hypothetical protein